jgi:hypothetical protein
MDIFGGRKFVEIPGDRTHELPPLLVHATPQHKRLDKVMDMANGIVESEELISNSIIADSATHEILPDIEIDRRRMDLAINLVEQYLRMLTFWNWGDGIIEWIKQCETTFEINRELRNVLRADVWPHASRSSFVTLLLDKNIPTDGVDLEKAVGLRLTFRQPPPIKCFSDQFLFYLNETLATTAYHRWTDMVPDPVSSLPPERFNFQFYNM